MSKDINKAPSYCPNAKATKRGWEDPKTGELLVSNRSLDLELINNGVSVNEPISASVETTLFDETQMMNAELELPEEVIPEPEETEVDFDSMTKTEICSYAENVLDLDLNVKETKKSLIKQIKEVI